MKKLLKQLLAVTTAIMMAITLLPAMANAVEAEPASPTTTIDCTKKGSITINKTTGDKDERLDGAKFALYKIADFSEGYNENADLLVKAAGKTKVGELLNLSESDQKTVASAYATFVEDKDNKIAAVDEKATATVNGEKGVAVFGKDDNNKSMLPVGYYLVVETDTPQGFVASTPFFVAIPQANNTSQFGTKTENETSATGWVYDITATPKNQKVTIGKKITSITDKDTIVNGQKATVKVGDKVGYTITSISPQYTDEYFNYNKETEADKLPVYKITDTLSSGLKYVAGTLEVKIKGKNDALTTLTENVDYELPKNDNNDNQITITFSQEFLKNEEYKGKEVTVTYRAEVLKSAAVTNPNTNEVELSYTNKPGSETKGVKSKDIPELYTYGLKVYKKDSNEEPLTGAKFKLYKVKDEGTKEPITNLTGMVNGVMTAKQDNEFIFSGLDVGDYELEEVESPKGYTLLTDTIKFSIGDTEPDGKLDFVSRPVSIETEKKENDTVVNTGFAKMDVTNKKGFNLPSIGGMGTYIFTIGGLVVMVGAVLLLVSSKKKRA